eukprot:TRINITY_DN9812_c0_g1_i1.p1 TRINITY_DN9812_c0_g1~~TRINITY_DN9812_c0_g1_i1.p1  ORF type:complete len:316 (+),score=39.22 TRINITY_DN9812_c0_g1_i1:541-1488(+)
MTLPRGCACSLPNDIKLGIYPCDKPRWLVLLRNITNLPDGVVQRRARAQAEANKPPVKIVDPNLLHTLTQQADSFKPTPLEKEHVAQVYESIASHWDRTRHSPWPQVERFLLEDVARDSLVADVGCGNGKYMKVADEHGLNMLGSDLCVNLVQVCGDKGLEASIADNMVLPYRNNLFDAAISIAVLHHFATPARRIRALQEVCRILRPGGLVLVQAWALEQGDESKRAFPDQDVLVPWCHLNPELEAGHQEVADAAETAAQTGSQASSEPTVYQRYCHVYKQGELEELLDQTGYNMQVLRSFYDKSNWCVVARKT